MYHSWCNILVLGFSLGGFSVAVSETCPYDDKNCVCSDRKVVCTNLDSVPQLKSHNSNVDTVIFSNGTLRSIPGNSLPANLVSLTFENVPIANISDDAFSSSAATLRELNFVSLRLSELPTALMAIHNLTSLTVRNSQTYNNYNTTLMQHLGKSLRVLKLISNRITVWPTWFQDFTLLEEFSINSNTLTKPTQISLSSVAATLKSLDLGSMFLDETSIATSFAGLSLTDLDVSNNNLGRNMSVLENVLLPISKTLRNLYLDRNYLYSIPSTISKMDKLLVLNLRQNYITTIPSNSFPLTLRELHLDHNDIVEIIDTSFPDGSQMQTLYLDNNPLNVTSSLAFQPLQQLRVLSLQSTQLLTIPVSLSTLKHLQQLDLSYNFEIKCYCPRGQLVAWYNSLTQFTVTGSCKGYDSDYSYDIHDYFEMNGYKLICSGFTPVAYSWILYIMMIFITVHTYSIG